jgi:hypothetical protein
MTIEKHECKASVPSDNEEYALHELKFAVARHERNRAIGLELAETHAAVKHNVVDRNTAAVARGRGGAAGER